ncbi:MAG: ATP-binding protein [Longimicrobiales bacterium]|nr:ATP-binding protein [Longimicrobiales bacterium]
MRLGPRVNVACFVGTCLLGLSPGTATGQTSVVTDLSQGWGRMATAQPVDWSGPAVHDEGWPVTSLTDSWLDQGLSEQTGFVWYRLRVAVPEVLTRAPSRAALLVGELTYGSYELFADGRSIGGLAADGSLPFPRPRLIPLTDGVVDDGEILLAIRVERSATAVAADGPHAAAFAGLLIGPADVLALRMEATRLSQSRHALGTLLFAVIALLMGLAHLLLHASRTAERAYLWFGLACVALAVNALALSPWTAPFAVALGPPFRLSSASGHFAAALLLVFLYEAFGRRPRPWVAVYLASHVALGALVLLAPFRWVLISESPRFFWLLPGLALALGIGFVELRRGHPDARFLAAAAGVIALAEAAELTRLAGVPLPIGLPNVGFTLALLAVAAMLASRFMRAHRELDALRRELEARVVERTAALAHATQEANRANDAKSRFLANVSHELRTPLNSVIGFSNVLLKRAARTRGVLEAKELDFLKRIRSSGEHLLALVDRILDLSLIEAESVQIDVREVDLGSLVTRLLAELSTRAEDKGLHLTAVLPAHVEALHTDPVRMRQVLINLVENAIRFTEAGTVTVSVQATDGRARFIDVVDTGVGIPADRLAEIQAPFTQVDESASRRHHGLGLGLAIMKGICDLLGYRISLESEPGKGTRARIDLDPAADALRPEDRSAPAELRPSADPPPPNRVARSGVADRARGRAGTEG